MLQLLFLGQSDKSPASHPHAKPSRLGGPKAHPPIAFFLLAERFADAIPLLPSPIPSKSEIRRARQAGLAIPNVRQRWQGVCLLPLESR